MAATVAVNYTKTQCLTFAVAVVTASVVKSLRPIILHLAPVTTLSFFIIYSKFSRA